jgi:hypothetical protein
VRNGEAIARVRRRSAPGRFQTIQRRTTLLFRDADFV